MQEGQMTATRYHIFAPRSTAILYLAWEFGVDRAAAIADKMATDSRGWLDLSTSPGLTQWNRRAGRYGIFTRQAAEAAEAKIGSIVAHQEGRLGQPLTAGTIDIVREG
jgi:hypothetical protein